MEDPSSLADLQTAQIADAIVQLKHNFIGKAVENGKISKNENGHD